MIILSEYGSENVHVFAEDMEKSKFSNRFLLCAVAEYKEKTVSTLKNAKKETKCICHVLGMT